MDEIRAIIRKEYTTLFLTVGLVSIIVSIFLFTKIPYTMNIFFKLKLSKIIGSLALISMALLLLIGLFLRFILRMSYERILNYEEDFNN